MRRVKEKDNQKVNRGLMLVIDAVVIALLLILDQFTKYLAIQNLRGKSAYVLIDGVLELEYLPNPGASFGMLPNQKFFILFVGFVFMAVILFFLCKLPETRRFVGVHVLLSVVVAGGVGNMIDRIRFGYVVDFISFVLINFPIFNVADICIVVAALSLLVIFMFVFQEKDLEFLSFKQNRYREMK